MAADRPKDSESLSNDWPGSTIGGSRPTMVHGYMLYATRLELDLVLHDFATRGIDSHAANERIPVGLRAVAGSPADSDDIDTVLTLCRPLAVFAPIVGQLPSGIAADVALVTTAA